MERYKKIILLGVGAAPFLAFAQGSVKTLLEKVVDQISILPGLIIGLTIIYFLWNVFEYIQAGGDPKKSADVVKMITYSLIAIFVMVSVWGLVRVIGNTFGIREGTTINKIAPPQI